MGLPRRRGKTFAGHWKMNDEWVTDPEMFKHIRGHCVECSIGNLLHRIAPKTIQRLIDNATEDKKE